ncbi:MAG: hypothetical protein PHX43_09385 [Alphaproteobacteria bacterium]|nr:hypothetical protein [Alphaproteobacteria bacterium]
MAAGFGHAVEFKEKVIARQYLPLTVKKTLIVRVPIAVQELAGRALKFKQEQSFTLSSPPILELR